MLWKPQIKRQVKHLPKLNFTQPVSDILQNFLQLQQESIMYRVHFTQHVYTVYTSADSAGHYHKALQRGRMAYSGEQHLFTKCSYVTKRKPVHNTILYWKQNMPETIIVTDGKIKL